MFFKSTSLPNKKPTKENQLKNSKPANIWAGVVLAILGLLMYILGGDTYFYTIKITNIAWFVSGIAFVSILYGVKDTRNLDESVSGWIKWIAYRLRKN